MEDDFYIYETRCGMNWVAGAITVAAVPVIVGIWVHRSIEAAVRKMFQPSN